MPTTLKSSLSWHSAWFVSYPPPFLPKSSLLGLQCQHTLSLSLPSITLSSLASFPSSLTRVEPHQCSVAGWVSAHINPSPPLTLCIVKDRYWENERECDSPHLNLPLYPIPNPFCPSPSTGERGLEVCCHGDRPPLPVDLCVRVRVWHNGHVPAATLPELHSQDHQHARLTIPRPQNTLTDSSPPTSQHSRTRPEVGRCRGGGRVRVLMCLWNWNQNWKWTVITPITFIVTFFATNNCFSCMKKKEKHHHTLTCSFSSRC